MGTSGSIQGVIMFERIKKLFVKTPEPKKVVKKTAKELATIAGEPYIEVLSMDIDDTNPGNGAFELDWNDIFVVRLIKAGYQGKNDQDIVDNWFKAVCRNIIQENFEQEQADPEIRAATAASNRRDLGNGRTEVS